LIQVIAKGADGWWSGIVNGVEGWFPESYVAPLDDEASAAGGVAYSSTRPLSEPDYAEETRVGAEHYANFAALETSSATDPMMQNNVARMKRAS